MRHQPVRRRRLKLLLTTSSRDQEGIDDLQESRKFLQLLIKNHRVEMSEGRVIELVVGVVVLRFFIH